MLMATLTGFEAVLFTIGEFVFLAFGPLSDHFRTTLDP